MSFLKGQTFFVFLLSIVIGFAASFWVMAGLLGTELRLYGVANLIIVALLVALTILVILDGPLELEIFKWREGFWPETLALPEPKAKQASQARPRGNTLKVSAFIVVVVAAIATFASMIPQVESPAPEIIEVSGDLSGAELAAIGEEVFNSPEAGCLACHGLGQEGLRAPNLAGIGGLAATKVPGQSAEEYLVQSLVDPCSFVVEGYDCIMPQTLAQALGPAKVTALVAFMQSQGGEITVSLSADASEATEPESSGGPGVEGTTGEEIFANVAPSCATCHQLDAIGAAGVLGPDLSQIGGRLTADEIRESILAPNAVIAEDCPGAPCTPDVMPNTFGDQLTATQLDTLVTFLSEQR